MKITGIIPARFDSTRFPGKPLVDIGGKTMIKCVYEQASKSKLLNSVIVATDDERILKEVKNFGGIAIMTSNKHQNGTERCAEVAENLDSDIILNIQGDEPFIQPEQIDLLASLFNRDIQIGTLIKQHVLDEELESPSRVKVVVNKEMDALYFSRSVIPFIRNPNSNSGTIFYKHIGMYGFRKDVLLQLVKLPASRLELSENLEQLRWLENGYRINCAVTTYDALSIDTPDDLERIIKMSKTSMM